MRATPRASLIANSDSNFVVDSDARRSAELSAAGLIKEGEEIRFVINRMHDGRPLAGKIRAAWDGILEDVGEDVVRHSLRHTAATWQVQAPTCGKAARWLGWIVTSMPASERRRQRPSAGARHPVSR